MVQFATLLLDLDGTLVDAFTTIHRGYCHTLPQFDRPAPTMAQVRRAVGGGINQAMAQLIAECPKQYLWGYARYKQPRQDGH